MKHVLYEKIRLKGKTQTHIKETARICPIFTQIHQLPINRFVFQLQNTLFSM